MTHKHTNRLVHETSPYLQQHAHNPVDWYPWGEEAFSRARAENKPLLLSVGYSACHWCHVMEHESFENEEIAKLMNQLFINIKVDREERPDLDEIYMNAVQMLTGRGGWPMTVFLTPEGKPFYGGTYFPPVDRHNLPGFPRILSAVAQAYQDKPQEVENTTSQILGNLERLGQSQESTRPFSPETLAKAATSLAQHVDHVHGGLGGAPKFPNSMVFSLFLRHCRKSKDEQFLQMVRHTLQKMAEGGVYDHLGGGFHRYSVDEKWLVPHFEKMLYDNALLTRLYLETYQVTGDPFLRGVVEETLTYVMREMLHPEGGFYSTQDADSEGEEGKFFVWTQDEVMGLLGDESGEIFCRYYDVTDAGNFEHKKNILHPTLTLEQLAKLFRRQEKETTQLLAEARQKLFVEREKREKPLRDDKILTSWNGLMLPVFVEAYKVLGNPRYLEVAQKTTDFIIQNLYKEGRLLHCYKDGQAKFNAYLDDYSLFSAALIDLFEATFDQSYLDRARDLTDTMLDLFWDNKEGGFFYTSKDQRDLIVRSKSAYDGSTPSGQSAAVHNLLRLFHYTERPEYVEKAERVLKLLYDPMEQNPFGFSYLLSALDFYLHKPKEVVLLGPKEAPETRAMLSRIHSLFVPNKTLRLFDPQESSGTQRPSWLEGRAQVDGKLTIYVCENFTCSLPVTEWEPLKELLLQ
jgi:uncharacterized protein YyaL (SSP411 family)